MKIILAGGNGRVGQALTPLLVKHGHEVIVLSRKARPQTEAILQTHPYESLETICRAADVLVNLAVINTDSKASADDAYRVNHDFALELAHRARSIGIERFIQLSSVHALDVADTRPYANTKRRVAQDLAALGNQIQTVHLGLVYGEGVKARPAILASLPKVVQSPLARFFYALKPTTALDDLAEFVMGRAPNNIIDLGRGQYCLVDHKDANGVYRFCKRFIDVGFSLAVLIGLCWMMLAIWLSVKLNSKGPGILTQTRVGVRGQHFVCYKFRTMKTGTPQLGTHEVDGSYITKVGHFLRKTKLDELPQVINILKNEMSLIGPRPCLPVQSELIFERAKFGVDAVKPGLSGFSQIHGLDMSDPVALARSDASAMGLRGLLPELGWMVKTIGRSR